VLAQGRSLFSSHGTAVPLAAPRALELPVDLGLGLNPERCGAALVRADSADHVGQQACGL
jgi:hypothetical protein